MRNPQTSKRFWNRKRIIIISSVLVVVGAITVYTLLSAQAWNKANTATAQASAELKKSVDDKLTATTEPASTQAALDGILKSYNNTLIKGPCELPSLYEWQSTLPILKDKRQKCLDTTKNSEALVASLKNMQTFLKEESGAALLVKQVTDSTASLADYGAAAAAWQKVADDKSLVATDNLKPLGNKVSEVSVAIAGAFTTLSTANTKQDKASFNDAQKGLSDAYGRLTEIKTTASEVQAKLVDLVLKAYSNV